jgi:putative ABC transport system permease protein
MRENGADPAIVDAITEVDPVGNPNADVGRARNLDDDDFTGAEVVGLSESFIANNGIKFSGRAAGYETDQEVWSALATNPEFAVIDSFSVEGGGNFGGFIVDGIEATDEVFEPVEVEIRNASTEETARVTIIGVTDPKASFLFEGLLITPQRFRQVYGEPETSRHYVKLRDGADARDVAREIERTLLKNGTEAESMREFIEEQQALSRGFLYLIQGFMGLGLFVGIAAVGVIAFRTVVERRQQIGMLRAIGYTRRAVALSFLMESSFVTLLGIASGIGLGLLLAQQLVQTDDFVPGGVDSFYIPWVQIGVIGSLAFAASLLMTLIPSRQASGVPIAEALRYE